MATRTSKYLFLFLLSLIVSSFGTYAKEVVSHSSRRELLNSFHYKATQHDLVDQPISTYPTTPVTNPVTTPGFVTPDNPAPTIVTVPAKNPVAITPNPIPIPPAIPSTNPIPVPNTNPISPAVPVTNPVAITPNPIPIPPAIPSTNPIPVPNTNPISPEVPVTNPVAITPNPIPIPPAIPSTNPIPVPNTNPISPAVPVTNPVTAPSTNPPVTNPVTTPTPSGGLPGPTPVTNPNQPPVTTPVTNPNQPPVTTNAPAVPGQSWCIAKNGLQESALQSALDYACGMGGADCSAIQQDGMCYNPNSLQYHASFAFNSYYQKNPTQTSCDFGGTAMISNTNPSTGSCVYPLTSSTPSLPVTSSTPTTAPTSGGIIPGSVAPPTVLNASNPASGGTSTGFGEIPPSATTSTSKSNKIQYFGCITIVASIFTGNIVI